ncbi:MAG: hypothetical protein CM15mP117_23380 [Alphaproteobacteria bacterium]|nr:MAG: hypothetical protein CM15mP117_23380 [Alphaproteobacteria bacterium]
MYPEFIEPGNLCTEKSKMEEMSYTGDTFLMFCIMSFSS